MAYKVNLVAVMVDLLLPDLGVRQGMISRDLSATLNTIFTVTYDLESHNAISIYCTSHILPTVKLVVWTL